MKFSGFIFGVLITVPVLVNNAQAERIKDLASIAGVRSNQLTGYGLVVGLDGTGDQTSQAPFTVQSLKSMLAQFGITIPLGVCFINKKGGSYHQQKNRYAEFHLLLLREISCRKPASIITASLPSLFSRRGAPKGWGGRCWC